MRGRLLSAFYLFLLFAGAFFALICFLAAFSPVTRDKVLVAFNGVAFAGLGLFFLVVSLVLSISLGFIHRRVYYRVEMDQGSFAVEEKIAADFVQRFFQEQKLPMKKEVEVGFSGHNRMEITLYADENGHEPLLKTLHSLEKDLRTSLKKSIGYSGRCFITVAFAS